MDRWEQLLNISKPEICKRTAACCLTATSLEPWKKITAASKNQELKDFFNIFIPYLDKNDVKEKYPDAFKSSIEIASSRSSYKSENLYFYYCRFLDPPNHCQIYEDRPSLCRSFPESPFDAIPETCGYYEWACNCRQKYYELQTELKRLKLFQYSSSTFFITSPAGSWLK
jgi:Fe-S-cluster containining protein